MIEEEFAYGYSIGFLRQKGHSDEQIIKDNFSPFLMMMIKPQKSIIKILKNHNIDIDDFNLKSDKEKNKIVKKYESDLMNEIMPIIMERGKDLIRIYNDKLNYLQLNKTNIQQPDLFTMENSKLDNLLLD